VVGRTGRSAAYVDVVHSGWHDRSMSSRKVVVYELISLDGVAANPAGFLTDWDDAVDATIADVIATQVAVILGRRSYDE